MSSTKLDMREAGNKMWIMKMPRFLLEHLQHEASEGRSADLGTVTPSAAAGSGPSSSSSVPASSSAQGTAYTLKLKEANLPEGLPREYEMKFNAPPPATYIFSSGASGAPPAHKGRAEARGEIRPKELDATYRNLLRERGERAGIRKQLETIEDDKDIKRTKLGHRDKLREEKLDRAKKLERREQNASKRSKPQLSARELKDALKELYTKQAYWTRRELVAELGNERILGAALEELCDKVTKRGNHYGDYELKPAFRTGLPGSSS
jgi:hypothetical protein